jgi:hypothetical protein
MLVDLLLPVPLCFVGHYQPYAVTAQHPKRKMSIVTGLDAIRDALPEGLPLSLVGIAATIVIGILYSIITQERPLAGFPLASIDGMGPKKSWLFQGKQLVAEGSKKVYMPRICSVTPPR